MLFPHPLGNVYEVSWKSDHYLNSRHKWVNKTSFTFFTFTTQKLNKKRNKIISQLVSDLFLLLFHLMNSSCSPVVARNLGWPGELLSFQKTSAAFWRTILKAGGSYHPGPSPPPSLLQSWSSSMVKIFFFFARNRPSQFGCVVWLEARMRLMYFLILKSSKGMSKVRPAGRIWPAVKFRLPTA